MKAARWRANILNYSKGRLPGCLPGMSLLRSQAIGRGAKPVETLLSGKPGKSCSNGKFAIVSQTCLV